MPTDRMAGVLGISPKIIERFAASMGLVAKHAITPHIFLRNRYSIIRRNWDFVIVWIIVVRRLRISHVTTVYLGHFITRALISQLDYPLLPYCEPIFLKTRQITNSKETVY